MLNETQLLLLNNLIYLGECNNPQRYPNNDNLELKYILKQINPEQCDGICKMSAEEWKEIIDMALSDETIKNLKVTNRFNESETGASMACFVDKDGQAYAVFSGTGANEWRDDCVAGSMTDSPQQEKALVWFNNLPYDNIVVSGHSKGGNKAMYVTITSDKAAECYSFDGQGFSNEFCEKYAEEIKRKKLKIHQIANYRDFVNTLLISIAGDVKYIVNDDGVLNPAEYHSPNAMFLYEDGKIKYSIGIGDSKTQDPIMEMLNRFTVYLVTNATESERILVLSVMGEMLTSFVGGSDGKVREDILGMFGVEAVEIFIRYLGKYLKDLKVSDPKTYMKYREAFGDFSGDALGDGIWQYFLGTFLVEPFVEQKLFDGLENGSILILFKLTQQFIGGNIRGRDFSQSIKEIMINAAKETEDEKWWQVTRWDCWYRIENLFGGLQWDLYTGKVDEYYRKLIDINDASVQDIEKIFSEVYQLDTDYAAKMSEETGNLNDVLLNLERIRDSINPE